MLTLFDLAMIITEHMIRTTGKVSSFDVERLLVKAHNENKVLLVMLSKTPHQIYHANPEFFLPFEMCIGEPWKFLEEYKYLLEKTKEQASHMLSEKEEILYSKLSMVASSSWSDLQSNLTSNLSIKVKGFKDKMPLSMVRYLAYDSNRD